MGGFSARRQTWRVLWACCAGTGLLVRYALRAAQDYALSVAQDYVLSRGSSASRKPSPSRLKPKTVSMIARPGKRTMWGEVKM